MSCYFFRITLIGLSCLLSAVSYSAERKEFQIIIKDHRFSPAVLDVPAGERITLIVINKDKTPEEFESFQLKREKIVPPNATIKILVGPLKQGEYSFFGEFFQATAQGKLIAK